jgi:leader peptidase (prepilin peptidase) / N-methyltransferase
MDAPLPGVILWMLVIGIGACVGSFLNVCIHRLPRRLSVVRPRSACPSCAAPIAWHDNVPLLSYLLLRGRCRRCRAPIALRYPLVEAATAALFALLFATRGPSIGFLLDAVLGAALIALILIDAEHQILPDAITLPGIAIGLLASPLRAGAGSGVTALTALRDAALAAALGYALPWTVNAAYHGWQALRRVPAAQREDGIGQGDFKLLAMIGAFLGVKLLLFSLFVGAVSGALFGVGMMLFGGYGWKSKLPYGVFLGGAALLALFAGESSMNWYLRLSGITP